MILGHKKAFGMFETPALQFLTVEKNLLWFVKRIIEDKDSVLMMDSVKLNFNNDLILGFSRFLGICSSCLNKFNCNVSIFIIPELK